MFLIFITALIFPLLLNGSEIYLKIKNIDNASGFVHFALYNEKMKFLSDDGKYIGLKKNAEKVKTEGILIKNLKAGIYAIAVYHDENSNDQFDKIFAIPKEKYGFSNDAKVFFGPPSFDEASFEINENEKKNISIKLR